MKRVLTYMASESTYYMNHRGVLYCTWFSRHVSVLLRHEKLSYYYHLNFNFWILDVQYEHFLNNM
jgi:hypothetical protein